MTHRLLITLLLLTASLVNGQTTGSLAYDIYNGTTFEQKTLVPSEGMYLKWQGGLLVNAAAGGGTWGSITGTLSDQTDLQSALDAKLATNGNGANVTDLNANNISTGTLDTARLPTVPVASGGTSTTTLAANAVLLGNGTSALQTVAPSTNRNVLTSNGTTWTSSPPIGLQAETIDYAVRVTTAGGTISNQVLAAIDELIVELKANSVWTSIDECSVFWGTTIAAQAVKLKYPSGAASSLTTTNFTDADCTDPRAGFGPGSTNSSKYAQTDYIPASNSRTYLNFSFGVSFLGLMGIGDSFGCPLVDTNVTTAVKLGINPVIGGVFPLAGNAARPNYIDGLHSYSLTASGQRYCLDNAVKSLNTFAATPTYTTVMSFWRTQYSNTTTWGTGRIGFYFLGATLSETQQRALGAAVRRFEIAVGRRRAVAPLVVIGDSITAGYNSSPAYTTRWGALLANSLNLPEINLGVEGCTLQGTAATSVLTRYTDAMLFRPAMIAIMIGTNDTTFTNFQANLNTVVSGWITAGMAPQNIILFSMPYRTSTLTFAQCLERANAARTTATTYGTRYVDAMGLFFANPSFIADTIHPTTAGHAAIAKTALEELEGYPRDLIGIARGINLNATGDQAIRVLGTRRIIRRIVITNASTSLAASGVTATIRDTASGGGNAIVATVAVTGLTTAAKFAEQTLFATAATDYITANPIFINITVAHGSAASADIYVYGDPIE